jgi:hypothetical protein
MVGWTAGIQFMGLLARDLGGEPNLAENFARHRIFSGPTENNEISDISVKFRRKKFPCVADAVHQHEVVLRYPLPLTSSTVVVPDELMA